mgnify:CR=1 FL=1
MQNYLLLTIFTLALSTMVWASCYHPEELHDVDEDRKLTCDYGDRGGQCGYD